MNFQHLYIKYRVITKSNIIHFYLPTGDVTTNDFVMGNHPGEIYFITDE